MPLERLVSLEMRLWLRHKMLLHAGLLLDTFYYRLVLLLDILAFNLEEIVHQAREIYRKAVAILDAQIIEHDLVVLPHLVD